jgi:hypothetical protein
MTSPEWTDFLPVRIVNLGPSASLVTPAVLKSLQAVNFA